MAEIVGKVLAIKGTSVSICHAGMTYEDRMNAIDDFSGGRCTVAVATNVLARGIDIPNARVVVNFEMPEHSELKTADTKRYWYRIGRASRFGKYLLIAVYTYMLIAVYNNNNHFRSKRNCNQFSGAVRATGHL